MNIYLKGLISGVSGAISLTAVHQLLKKIYPNAPKIDILGAQAISKFIDELKLDKPSPQSLHRLSLAGDLIFNSVYYSAVARGKKPLLNAMLLGTGAGGGVITLPRLMNLNQDLSAKNLERSVLSFSIYIIGGLVSAGVYKLIQDL